MAYSRVVATGNGSTNQFAVNFALDYLLESDVTCRVGTEVDGGGNPIYRTLTFLSTNLVQVGGSIPGNGVQIVFERTVDKDTLRVDYNNGDQFDEDNLMIAQKQAMMAVHEVLDGRFSVLTQDLDAGGFGVVNVRAPVAANDVATKVYVDTVTDVAIDAGETAVVQAAIATTAAAAAQADASEASDTLALTVAAQAGAVTAQTGAQTAQSAAEDARDTTLAALSTKADKASPVLTGVPTAPTAAPGTDTVQLATTEFVQDAVASAGAGPAPANTFKANNTGATAPPTDITPAEAAAMLPVFSSGTKGLVPAPTAGDITDGDYLNAAGIWVPKKIIRTQSWLTIIRHSATSANGTSSGAWAFPGSALSASAVQFNGSTITGCRLYSARWVVAWNPNATTASPNGVALAKADSGPTNVVHLTSFTRASTTTPVVDAVDVTAALQLLLDTATTKFICHQVVGNGTTGPMIYSSEVELIWEFTGT
ncbi:hypothetical protein [Bradyrhizobium retamae]|uniref:hypothetical protein n=1 Tax=Bradyrhizobium retamae TaxID=1300035 RepID=UPI000B1CA264|nr:hypothetical protein [Bradyrhizobium retamae]